jgi:hypothetical protein
MAWAIQGTDHLAPKHIDGELAFVDSDVYVLMSADGDCVYFVDESRATMFDTEETAQRCLDRIVDSKLDWVAHMFVSTGGFRPVELRAVQDATESKMDEAQKRFLDNEGNRRVIEELAKR